MASTKPNHLPKAPSPNTITLGVGLQHVDLEATFHPQHPLVGRQAPRMLEETMWEAARKATIPVFKHKSKQTRPSSAKSHLSSRPAFLISWLGVWRVGEDDQVRNPPPRADPAPSIRGALVEQEDILHVFAATKTTLPRAQVPLSWTRVCLWSWKKHRLTLQHGKYTGTGFGRTPRPASPTQQCRNGPKM